MGMGTPGREAAFPFIQPNFPGSALAVRLACFLVRLGGRFLVPACAAELASRAGAVKDARKRARQGLSLTAPSTAPGLGAVGTRWAPYGSSSQAAADPDLRPGETAASTTTRLTGTASSSALSAPPIKRRDWRALKQREPA